MPTDQVAVVDFTGKPVTDADWAKVPEGKHVLWMTSGCHVTGQFTGIGGTNPLSRNRRARSEWVTFNATGQIRLTNNATDMAGPAGAAANRTGANAQVPAAPIGALIGRRGERPA